MLKNTSANAGDLRDVGSIPGSGRYPRGGHGNPLQLFLPGESPWTEELGGLQSIGSKSDTTEVTEHVLTKQETLLGSSTQAGAGR